MKELYHLLTQCFICWLHGFGTKTGGEQFLYDQALKENARQPVGSQMNPSFDYVRYFK
jgi:hypothetical protein